MPLNDYPATSTCCTVQTRPAPTSSNSFQENVPPSTINDDSKNGNLHSPRPCTNYPYYTPHSMLPIYGGTPYRYAHSEWYQYMCTKPKDSTSYTDGISNSVREAFIPPRHNFTPKKRATSQNHVTPEGGKSKITEQDSSNITSSDGIAFNLEYNDIVCGRGAPTDSQHGNQLFKDLVEEHQTSYLCAKRADKPKIAMLVMDEVHACGGRFVRRVKTATNGRSFGWEKLEDKRSYEKVCQALRDGAPALRRKMLAATRIREDFERACDASTSESAELSHNFIERYSRHDLSCQQEAT